MSNKLLTPEVPALADITTCMVPVKITGTAGFKPCGHKFSSPRVAIIGDNSARLNALLNALAKHLHDKHPEVGLGMAQHGAAFMELLFLRNFQTTDTELTTQQDRVRWQVHQQTLKCRYPDENIVQQADELADRLNLLALENERTELPYADLFAPLLVEAFTAIRDALEEPGKYEAPVQGSAKVLVS